MSRYTKFPDFFEARILRTDTCWEWDGRFDGVGYGTIQKSYNSPNLGAHRASWLLHNGDIPDGMHVCHHCDNRKCVRPDHLFLGTAKDNLQDASRKGRLSVPGKSWERNKTHCSNGHPFNDANTYCWHNHRICRVCRKENERRRRWKLRAAR